MNGPHILCELFNDLNHVDKVVAKMTEGNTASAIVEGWKGSMIKLKGSLMKSSWMKVKERCGCCHEDLI